MQDAEKQLLLYKETGDTAYFACFLEAFAPHLDRRILRFAKLYKLEHHIEDLKSVYIETILTELPSYDPTLKVPFFAFAEKHCTITLVLTAAHSLSGKRDITAACEQPPTFITAAICKHTMSEFSPLPHV